MNNQLVKLEADLIGYRRAVDQIFSPALITSKSWQECLSEILIQTAQLYLDYLVVTKGLSELEPFASGSDDSGSVATDPAREMRRRTELKRRLDSSTSWPGFRPHNSFSNLTGFRTRQDYIESFTLHLPEIYEETFRVEAYIESFLTDRNSAALVRLSIGLRHLGQNHASFVLQPLEWAADEDSWDESLVDATP